MKICYTVGGVGLFALSMTAAALTLGQSQGQAVLGTPLDLVFQLEPDSGMDAASSCVAAEVMLGDRRIDGSRVRITPLSTRAGQPAAVRVRATVMVDEPVVTVRLSAGCAGQVSRSYTFFAELPEAVAPSAMPLDISQLGALPAAGAAPQPSAARPRSAAPPSASASSTPRVRPEAASPRPAPAPRPPRKPVAKPPQPAPAAAQAEAGAGGQVESRLRMEPLNTWLGTPPNPAGAAGSGASAGAAPAGSGTGAVAPPAAAPTSSGTAPNLPSAAGTVPLPAAAAPAPAAPTAGNTPVPAAVPAAAAANPTDSDPRMLALEAEMQALRARDARHNASLNEMRSQLEALQSNQGSPWTLPLLVALAIALAVLAWLLMRLRSLTRSAPANAWLHSVGGASRLDESRFAAASGAPSSFPGATLPASMPSATFGAAGASEFGPSTLRASMLFDPQASSSHRPRDVVKPEDLFDVRQQAEFFTSVGEYEQAIAVLRKHIAEHEDSSPLAYLELLGLFYQLSRRTEYDALRQQFEQHFAVRVPEMAQFAQRGLSLEYYPELLARIEALWPTDEVCGLLETALFREPGQDSEMLFDLEAFDDLMLLQAVARTTPAEMRGLSAGRVRTAPATAPVAAPAMASASTLVMAPLATLADDAAMAAPALDMGSFGIEMPGAAAADSPFDAPAALVPGDEPWATLERVNAAPPPLMPELLEPAPLSLDLPLDFEAPPGAFARSAPLVPDNADSPLPEMPTLLDIDLSDVGRAQPLDLPSVEALPFDLEEFPARPIIGSGVDQSVGFNPGDPRLPLPDSLELTPWESDDSPDSIFSAWNAARTERVLGKSGAADGEKDKPEGGRS